MFHLGVGQLVTVYHIQFTVQDGWVKFKVLDSQNFWRGKRVYYQFCSTIYVLQEQMSDTDFWKMARPKSKQDLLHWARQSAQRRRRWLGCARVNWKRWKHECFNPLNFVFCSHWSFTCHEKTWSMTLRQSFIVCAHSPSFSWKIYGPRKRHHLLSWVMKNISSFSMEISWPQINSWAMKSFSWDFHEVLTEWSVHCERWARIYWINLQQLKALHMFELATDLAEPQLNKIQTLERQIYRGKRLVITFWNQSTKSR